MRSEKEIREKIKEFLDKAAQCSELGMLEWEAIWIKYAKILEWVLGEREEI